MSIRRAAIAIAAISIGALGVPAVATATGSNHGPDAVALVKGGTALVRIDTDRPAKLKSLRTPRLAGDTALIGIDRRVQNGRLYGVGNQGGIYTLSARSARAATKVGQLTIALQGTSFGVDFNPAANALRIVSDTGQNLRQPFGTTDSPTAPTVADGPLNYLGVTAPGVTGAAYTNNDLDASTATSLFDLDTTLDQVALQSPANSGALAATGKFGVDAGSDAGFDIYSDLRNGKTVSAQGFAVLGVAGRTGLYSVNLLTGEVALKGHFSNTVTDIAVDLDK